MTLQPEMLLLAFLASLICVKAFMPNYVFPFQPNTNSQSHQTITDEDVDLIGYNVDSFYPTETKDGLIDDGSLTHKDITRLGCLRAVARFYEERLCKTPGSLEKINPLTSETLLRTVFGNHTSTKNFELALQEIETQAALMDAWYETNENVTEELSIARQHFDDESFEEGQAYLWGLSKALFIALTKESYSSARTFSGRFLLTMQDFYAHSNWVELKQGLGQTEILEELGQRPPSTTQFLKNVAGPSQPTCTDCSHCSEREPSKLGECQSNVAISLLTSGYFYYPWDFKRTPKPDGKCSHGDEADQSRVVSATGGINKSTKNCRKSPHYYLHDDAAELAVKATTHFFKRLRDVVGDKKFRAFFQIPDEQFLLSNSSLCFVMDKSSSMRNYITLAKERIQQIVQSSPIPDKYLLIQFSDYDNRPGQSFP
jgi:hypothetical protein